MRALDKLRLVRIFAALCGAGVAAVLAALVPAAFANSLSISGSMEGSIHIANGYFVAAGYSFTITGSHPDVSVVVANATVTFQGTCSNGSPDNTLVVPLRAVDVNGQPYLVPSGSSGWFPSNDEGAAASFQGSVVANVCGGDGTLDASRGGTFSADIQTSPTGYTVNFRFHYRVPAAKGGTVGNVDCSTGAYGAATCGASWSGTTSVSPDPISLHQPTITSAASGARNAARNRRHPRLHYRILGQTLQDTATLSGGQSPTGFIKFDLYGPDDDSCTTAPVFSDTEQVSGNGSYPSLTFIPSTAGTYRWVAIYSGDANNETATTHCGDDGETDVVSPSTPSLTTTAPGPGTVGEPLHDTATLSGGTAPTGTISWNVYNASDTGCSMPLNQSPLTTTVNGNGPYPSPEFIPAHAGTLRWVATYSGDSNNVPAGSSCGDTGETVTVVADQPSLTTTASEATMVGNPISDTAHLTAGTSPTGTIRFTLYGPNDSSCSGSAIFSSTVTVSGDGDYTTPTSFTPSAPGTYQWVASYSGDADNLPAASACGAEGESVVVDGQPPPPEATPALTTTASTPGPLPGSSMTDTATLSLGNSPTGSITFELFGPNDTSCSGAPVFTSEVPVDNGNASYTSAPPFTPTDAGTYSWRASYSGDANNHGVPLTACGEATETVDVAPASPTIDTTGNGGGGHGSSTSGTGHLRGGSRPTGEITFRLYGPRDDNCTGTPEDTVTVDVSGNGDYTSPSFIPRHAGTYHWTAQYHSGDANNKDAGPSACDENTVPINRARPFIFSLASGATSRRLASNALAGATGGRIGDVPHAVAPRYRAAGLPIHDTVDLSRTSPNPGGFVKFLLYGPGDFSCTGTPAFETETEVAGVGPGDIISESFVPRRPGTYHWVASYSGDEDNQSAGPTRCGDRAENVHIHGAVPSLHISSSGSVKQGHPVHGIGYLNGGDGPRGRITFSLYGPDDRNCSRAPAFRSGVRVRDNGTYTSPSFAPRSPGTYRWVARYSGDSRNHAQSTGCNEPAGIIEVSPPGAHLARPRLRAHSPFSSAPRGTRIYGVARLNGGRHPTGTITFVLYGPDDRTCSRAPAFTSSIPVSGGGTYSSARFVVSAPGTYSWVAKYSGDGRNHPAGPTACGATAATVNVSPHASPDPNPVPPIGPGVSRPHPPRRPPAFTG